MNKRKKLNVSAEFIINAIVLLNEMNQSLRKHIGTI
jgi:hypothetical protein